MRAVWPQSDLGTLREMRPNMVLPTKLSVMKYNQRLSRRLRYACSSLL
jgi:hypothetical protein